MGNESSTVPQIKRTKVDLVSDDEGQDARHEVDLQGGAPLREEEGGGGENQAKIPQPRARDRGEGPQGAAGRPRQEEVPRPLRPDRRPVLLPHPEEDQPQAGGRTLLLRQQHIPAHLGHHGSPLPGASRGDFFLYIAYSDESTYGEQ